MKKLIIVGLIVMLTFGIAFAGGDQNQNQHENQNRGEQGDDMGQGNTERSTGDEQKGEGVQDHAQERDGR